MVNEQYAAGIAGFAVMVVFFVIWSAFWKGLALWHSARNGSTVWFVILLVINTVGILEIIYLSAVLKLKITELFSKKIQPVDTQKVM